MRADRERLLDILETIDRIEKYADSREAAAINFGIPLIHSKGFGTFSFQTCNPLHRKGHLRLYGRMMRLVPKTSWMLPTLRNSLVHRYDEVARHHQAPQPLGFG